MTACCPTCGQPVAEADTLLVSPTGASVTRLGAGAVLTMSETTILAMMRKKYPAHAVRESIILDLYGLRDEPENAENTVRVLIHRLRHKLAPLGVDIENSHGFGYRLVFRDAPIVRRAA